jgi:hypothetical protein
MLDDGTSPEDVANEMDVRGIERFIFNIDSTGQFDTKWSVYVHEDEVHLLEDDSDSKWNIAEDIPINSDFLIIPVREEFNCCHCKRPNDVGVTTCWMCGNDPNA